LKIQLLQQTLDGTALSPAQFTDKKSVLDAVVPAFKEQLHQQWGIIYSFESIHWLYFCQGLFVLTAVLMIVISLLTKAPDPATVKYTYYGATAAEKAATRASWNAMDVVCSLIVLGCIVWFYIAFF